MTDIRHPASGCPFCQPDSTTNQHIARHGTAYARLDNYPATDGHIEILPARHAVSITDLTPTEITDMHTLLCQIVAGGDADGWTIGINEGPAAGRTVDHVHLHVIPRRWGDVPDPRGGVRHVLPGTDPDRWDVPDARPGTTDHTPTRDETAAGARQDGTPS